MTVFTPENGNYVVYKYINSNHPTNIGIIKLNEYNYQYFAGIPCSPVPQLLTLFAGHTS